MKQTTDELMDSFVKRGRITSSDIPIPHDVYKNLTTALKPKAYTWRSGFYCLNMTDIPVYIHAEYETTGVRTRYIGFFYKEFLFVMKEVRPNVFDFIRDRQPIEYITSYFEVLKEYDTVNHVVKIQ